MSDRNWRLSPSDFAFLWEECKRCFYLKIVQKFSRPRPIMPKIFKNIDTRMNAYFSGMKTREIISNMPDGIVKYGERWVESEPIQLKGKSSTCFISGKFDSVINFDDGTYGVIDFKTSERKSEHIPLYSRQLHAYTYALEHPAPGKLALSPVSKLGLIVFEPDDFYSESDSSAYLKGDLTWIEIKRDDISFMKFLGEVVSVLEQPNPPGGSPSCGWCQYRDISRRTGV